MMLPADDKPSLRDLMEDAQCFIRDNVGVQDQYIDYEGKTKLLDAIEQALVDTDPASPSASAAKDDVIEILTHLCEQAEGMTHMLYPEDAATMGVPCTERARAYLRSHEAKQCYWESGNPSTNYCNCDGEQREACPKKRQPASRPSGLTIEEACLPTPRTAAIARKWSLKGGGTNTSDASPEAKELYEHAEELERELAGLDKDYGNLLAEHNALTLNAERAIRGALDASPSASGTKDTARLDSLENLLWSKRIEILTAMLASSDGRDHG